MKQGRFRVINYPHDHIGPIETDLEWLAMGVARLHQVKNFVQRKRKFVFILDRQKFEQDAEEELFVPM